MSDSPLTAPDLGETFGIWFVSCIISTWLCGVTCLQVWNYYRAFPRDSDMIKTMVGLVLVMDVLHTAALSYANYGYLVSNYMNPDGLLKASWTMVASVVCVHGMTMIVQLFYIRRIYYISNKRIVFPILLFSLVAAKLGVVLALIVQYTTIHFVIADFPKFQGILIGGFALGAITDCAMAGTLCYYLRDAQDRTATKSTQDTIRQLIFYALENALITSALHILSLLFSVIKPSKLIHSAIYQVLGHTYANAMLTVLNARLSGKKTNLISDTDMSVSMNTIRLANHNNQQETELGRDDDVDHGHSRTVIDRKVRLDAPFPSGGVVVHKSVIQTI